MYDAYENARRFVRYDTCGVGQSPCGAIWRTISALKACPLSSWSVGMNKLRRSSGTNPDSLSTDTIKLVGLQSFHHSACYSRTPFSIKMASPRAMSDGAVSTGSPRTNLCIYWFQLALLGERDGWMGLSPNEEQAFKTGHWPEVTIWAKSRSVWLTRSTDRFDKSHKTPDSLGVVRSMLACPCVPPGVPGEVLGFYSSYGRCARTIKMAAQ